MRCDDRSCSRNTHNTYGIYRIMQNTTSGEICQICAECCKHYPFVELSQSEVDALEAFTGLSLDVFTNSKGKAVEEYFLQFREDGDCVFLNAANGRYSCSVYEARSGSCRNYPSTPSQDEHCNANRKMCLSKAPGYRTEDITGTSRANK